MEALKKYGIPAVIALVVVWGFSLVSKPASIGGVPGVNPFPSTWNVTGGVVNATTTPTNSTLVAADIDDENVVAMTLTTGAGTLTFPASSSFPGIPNPGDTRTIWVRNATTSAATGLTIAGNTGVTLKRAASSTALLVGDTDGKNTAKLDFVRLANTDIVMLLTKYED